VNDLHARIDELAELMEEFELADARLSGDGWFVEFGREAPAGIAFAPQQAAAAPARRRPAEKKEPPKPEAPVGTPIESPMTGIFYASPSPGAPPFVKEGDRVERGQVLALIEAMKVFNEIVAPMSGGVLKVAVVDAQLVQPGEALMYIE
jgi:acetyl-CoA carboxylase biotin carboxyl carrier protein